MLIPTATTQYADYAAGRGPLTLARDSILNLQAANDDGRQLGLHPSMPGLTDLNRPGKGGDAGQRGNITGADDAQSVSQSWARRFHQTCSHTMTNRCFGRRPLRMKGSAFQPNGWGGRVADLIHSAHNDSSLSMLISLGGTNFFQVADTLQPVRLPGGGLPAYKLGQDTSDSGVERYANFRKILDKGYSNMLESAFSDVLESRYQRHRHRERCDC